MELSERVLASLNASQKEAVTSPCSGVLQIVAGPGTGKTKVLVSRVAYLLLHENVLPHAIIVTTFTKKAANEMMERLREMFNGTDIAVGNLLIGTFHSICFKIIQKYGKHIGIENYAIADERDASQVLKDVLLKRISDSDWHTIDNLPPEQTRPFKGKDDNDKYRGLDIKKLRSKISQLKAAGITIEDLDEQNPLVRIVYSLYQQTLSQNRLLDFDDCLLYCHKIISRFPVLRHIEHTLVDEFQDTNEIQLQLMYEFARGNTVHPKLQHNVTIVGDPDQSIYAFRHAQSGNFDSMRTHYRRHGLTSNIITLTENYRSTSDILTVSEQIMRQQTNRMTKNLRLQMRTSFKPMKAHLDSADQEARWIAYQIGYLKKFPNLFEYSDIAILVRSAYQTRVIETELTKKKIPYFMVRGKAFWERKEVVAIVDYLRCVANKNDRIAYLRCANFPKRGLGQKSVAELDTIVERQMLHGILVHQTLRDISQSKVKSSLGPKMKQSLGEFMDIIDNSRTQLEECIESGSGQLDAFFMDLYSRSGLKKEFDVDDSDLNIMEVKSQLLDFTMVPDTSLPDYDVGDSFPNEVKQMYSQEISTTASKPSLSLGTDFLSSFLSLVTLYETNPDAKDSDTKPRVAISTIHGAKGLEWPIVFVPGVSEGLLPASFAENNLESINEERRCFYVATSRAKALLYVSSYTDGGNWGRRPIDRPSRFLDKLDRVFTDEIPIDSLEKLDTLYSIMGRVREGNFDFAATRRNYEICMKSYVNGDIESEPTNIGFTSVGKLSIDMNGDDGKGTTNLYRNKGISRKGIHTAGRSFNTIKDTKPLRLPGKAPAYIPMRPQTTASGGASTDSAISDSIHKEKNQHQKTSLKRAPAYIPVRPTGKRRLGTR